MDAYTDQSQPLLVEKWAIKRYSCRARQTLSTPSSGSLGLSALKAPSCHQINEADGQHPSIQDQVSFLERCHRLDRSA